MDSCTRALEALRAGSFVLVYDSEDREGEVDLVVPAEFVTPQHIYKLRSIAGGLICVAISFDVAQKLGLPFMRAILEVASSKFPALSKLAPHDIPYDNRDAFSITVNHRKTFTGVTDRDRALTIRELARIAAKAECCEEVDSLREEFGRNFRSPGHVHILIAAKKLLEERRGHTELSIALAEMAGLTKAVVICEMLDGETGGPLAKDKAIEYAKKFSLPYIEGNEIVKSYLKFKDG